jgi:hypothetical protein
MDWFGAVFRCKFVVGEDSVFALLMGVTVCRGECIREVIRLNGEVDIGAGANPPSSSKVKS